MRDGILTSLGIGHPLPVVPSLCTPALVFSQILSSTFFVSASIYRRRHDGSLLFAGTRPESGSWHGHGYFARFIWAIQGRSLVRVKLWKHRWLEVGASTTKHSRSDEETPSAAVCSTIFVLLLWTWLDSDEGLGHKDRREPIVGFGLECGSARTVQRALHRLLPQALKIQQALRRAVIERSEPRPVESLFRGGLSPPKALLRRRWKAPSAVEALWRALAILFSGALLLDVPVAHLLAEARGRWDDRDGQCPF